MLEIRHIDVAYGDVQVLWDLSFRVNTGEVVALIGANGAGKSTTLKTVSGLLRPRRGRFSSTAPLFTPWRHTAGSSGGWPSARRRAASSWR